MAGMHTRCVLVITTYMHYNTVDSREQQLSREEDDDIAATRAATKRVRLSRYYRVWSGWIRSAQSKMLLLFFFAKLLVVPFLVLLSLLCGFAPGPPGLKY